MDRATRPEGDFSDIQRGWDVYGSDEQRVGQVRETRGDRLVVRTGLRSGHDLIIPSSAVRRIDHDRVSLVIPSDAVPDQGWGSAPGG